MTQTLQAFVFDMDGVLIDSHGAHRQAWREFLREEGIKVSENELAFIFEGRTRMEILQRFLGDLSGEELRRYGQRKDDFFRSLERHIEPMNGVLPLIERLQQIGFTLAIATSASRIRTFGTIERLGLTDYFDAVVTASDVEKGKPDPAVYRIACERLNVHPSEAMAFDDACAGVQAARNAGMRCIGVGANGFCEQLLQAGAETVVPNFACPEFERVAETIIRSGRSAKIQ